MSFPSQLGKLLRRFKRLVSIHHLLSGNLLSFSAFNLSLFSCDFETHGSRSFCGWKDDPRDNGVTWSIIEDSNLESNILCLSPSAMKRFSNQEDFEDDVDFGSNYIEESPFRAKLWSPKYRIAKGESAPQCIKFSFKFDPIEINEPFALSLMSHSSRWWFVCWTRLWITSYHFSSVRLLGVSVLSFLF